MDIAQLEDRVTESLAAGDLARAAGLLEAAADTEWDDPTAYGLLWQELADELAERRRYDEAIATVERAIELGVPAEPDARCSIADYHQQAGRDAQADALWRGVLEDTPEDAWLYASAGWSYLDAGRHEQALWWLDHGMELCLKSGDPQGVMDQLLEARSDVLDALDLPGDELQERGEAFFARVLRQRPFLEAPVPPPAEDVTTVAWFPLDEFGEAMARWPELVRAGVSDHRDHVDAVQRALAALPAGHRVVAPVHVEAYLTWCEAEGVPPGSEASRDAYALTVANLGGGLPWPPGRNDPCWCGSGTKYKKCCARVT
jgi:tetratricopeptide (TPR) repeat protein